VEFHNTWTLGDVSQKSWGDRYDLIRISKKVQFSENLATMILLHEMAHLALPPRCDHCEHWKALMRKLAEWGAMDGSW
jgi:hypothetical protein